MNDKIYLDHAATTPLDAEVQEAMMNVIKNDFGNPSSIHALGRKSRIHIENARKTIASVLNASIGEIYFTSSATEANNMALRCSVRDLGVERIISTQAEHHCVLNTLKDLSREIKVKYLSLDQKGNIDEDELKGLLGNSKSMTLVSLMHANNEIGTMHNLERISEMCLEYGTLLHSDAVQSVGKFAIDVQKTKVNFLSGTAHKINGPKGIGFLYVNGDNTIKPLITGGSQERNLRAGTENLYGIVGFECALSLWDKLRSDRIQKTLNLRNHFKSRITQSGKDVIYFGNQDEYFAPHILSVGVPKTEKSELIMMNLDIAGICASAGSACSSGAEHDSHVLAAINAPKDRKAIRFSFSHHNTLEEIEVAAEKLIQLI